MNLGASNGPQPQELLRLHEYELGLCVLGTVISTLMFIGFYAAFSACDEYDHHC
jgi:hypothetical protein